MATSKQKKVPINANIRASEVMLINSQGDNLGIMPLSKALEMASNNDKDLVQVSPDSATQIICKIMDYGKHVFEKKKNVSSSKNKGKRISLKEIKFRPSTDTGDYNIKIKKIKSFILDGVKTKITVRFRGREILNSNFGLDLLERVREELSEISQVDQEPSLEGRQLLMILSPLKKKS